MQASKSNKVAGGAIYAALEAEGEFFAASAEITEVSAMQTNKETGNRLHDTTFIVKVLNCSVACFKKFQEHNVYQIQTKKQGYRLPTH